MRGRAQIPPATKCGTLLLLADSCTCVRRPPLFLLLTPNVESDHVEALPVIILAVREVFLVVNNSVLVVLVGPGLGRRRMQSLSRFPAHKKEKNCVIERRYVTFHNGLDSFSFDTASVTCRRN